ncbi:MAG: peptide chain release factor N(5)-glutamine methyltransferase [Acidobacteriota bacterium]
MTFVQSAADAARKLEAAGLTADESRRDAVVLARWCLRWSAADWLTRADRPATAEFSSAFQAAVERRARREPLAYITGEREFYGRLFEVTPAVLIPRPETELLVEEALRCLQQLERRQASGGQLRPRVLDIGTGSGCVAITLALEVPAAAVVATDVSSAALDVARRNARQLDAARIEFRHTKLVGDASDDFDLIVANPPYVPESTRASLPPEVREYEPGGALFAGWDGLDVIRLLVPAAARVLCPGGWLVMEIGIDQADEVTRILHGTEFFSMIRFARDLQGIERVVAGTG